MYKILCVTTISQSTLFIVFNIAKVGGPHYALYDLNKTLAQRLRRAGYFYIS